jgi:hypothetical protein
LRFELDIKKLEDWYHVSWSQMDRYLGLRLIEVMSLVKKQYPELDLQRFKSAAHKKSQAFLKNCLQNIFPQEG